MNDPNIQDWFAKAVSETPEIPAIARRFKSTAKPAEPDSARAREAVRAFTSTRAATNYNTAYRPKPPARAPITPEVGLAAIERVVREADDPLIAAGEWITRVTNSLSAIAQEGNDDIK